MWSKAFRIADGVGQVAWLERVKAWKIPLAVGGRKVAQHYPITPAKYAQNFFRAYESYHLVCRKLHDQRTKAIGNRN